MLEKKNMFLLSLVGPEGKILGSSEMTNSQNIFPFGPTKLSYKVVYHMTTKCWKFRQFCFKLRTQDNLSYIKYSAIKKFSFATFDSEQETHNKPFRITFTLVLKTRPDARPFVWKWVKFECKWKRIVIWKDSTRTHFENAAKGNSEMEKPVSFALFCFPL